MHLSVQTRIMANRIGAIQLNTDTINFTTESNFGPNSLFYIKISLNTIEFYTNLLKPKHRKPL